MADEARIDWYRSPLEKATLQGLTARSDARGFTQMVLQLLLTAATGVGAYLAYRHLAWPWAVAAVYLHGTVFSFLGLAGAGHELCHGTVFKTKFWNEFFLRLVAFLSWTNFVYFRASHHKHHQYTVHFPLDLEVVQPIRLPRSTWLYVFTVSPQHLWWAVRTLVRHSRGIVQGEWEERIFPASAPEKRHELFRWARVLLFGHLALAAVFIATGQWILLILVTFAPFYAGWLNFLCGFTQHVGLAPNVPDFRLSCRTVYMNPLVRFLYWQMNYHVEHHMYAGVPFYNLPKLRQAIAADLPPASPSLLAAWREITTILREQQEDPSRVITPQLPTAAPKPAEG